MLGDSVSVEWRSFLLRPQPDPSRTLELFREYSRSWTGVGEHEPGVRFRVWASDEGPPSHSVPPHIVAKAAARLGGDAFSKVHWRLLEAYFSDNRDITAPGVLFELWQQLELPDEAFPREADPATAKRILDEHDEALGHGVSGVPAARLEGRDGLLMGAQPADVYMRWIERSRRFPPRA